MNRFAQTFEEQDIVTIIAPSAADAMRAAKAQSLPAQGYSIQSRIVPHRFTVAGSDGDNDLFSGELMVSATWVRQRPCAAPASETTDATLVVPQTA